MLGGPEILGVSIARKVIGVGRPTLRPAPQRVFTHFPRARPEDLNCPHHPAGVELAHGRLLAYVACYAKKLTSL